MRVLNLKKDPFIYSSNIYLVLGDWNRIEDVNSIVDVGTDCCIMHEIERTPTGFGKRPLEQVVLTHGHFDHVSGLSVIKERYSPTVYAFNCIDGVDELLKDGETIRLGDALFEVIHTPGHSNDSICLYCREEHVLFSGDTPLHIRTAGGSYSESFVNVLERLAGLRIEAVYSGHDDPIFERAEAMIRETLKNVLKSKIEQ